VGFFFFAFFAWKGWMGEEKKVNGTSWFIILVRVSG
jgi:hypothetical protein